ncbi:MAG: hypothetical protein GXY15_04265 [Candidatus Hydrogenedentes bacterium]|nr:hypothetical protein [Candidatus Hydrogenedentota bacterium]
MNLVIGLSIVVIVVSAVLMKLMSVYQARAFGHFGERRVRILLEGLDPQEYRVFHDLMLESRDGTTQIDHVVVSRFGVFVLETKNISGKIYGRENAPQWTIYNHGQKYPLHNPLRQNYGHVQALRTALGNLGEAPMFPLVVFMRTATLKVDVPPGLVVMTSELVQTVMTKATPMMSPQTRDEISRRIEAANITDPVRRKAHVGSVKRRVAAREQETADAIAQGVCPKCGGQLVAKTGRYGTFTACSNFKVNGCRFKVKG